MKKIINAAVATACFLSMPFFNMAGQPVAGNMAASEKEQIIEKASKLKLPWIENKGLLNSDVAYYTDMAGGNVYVTTAGEVVYRTVTKTESTNVQNGTHAFSADSRMSGKDSIYISGSVWRESFVNGHTAQLSPEFISTATASYFKGNDPAKWEKAKPTYYTLSLGQVWNNVEVKLNRYGNSIEKRFYIYPGGNSNDIFMQINGADMFSIAEDGSLQASVKLSGDKMSFSAPVAYQYINDAKVSVPVHYVVKGKTYGFTTGTYNKQYPLIIDPVLSTLTAATFIGGSYYDYNNSIALDDSENVYICSGTLCSDYPTTTGAYSRTYAGNQDTYVSKFNSDLSVLIASTFIGGSSYDQGMFVTVAPNGDVFASGQTGSTDFPATSGAFQTSAGGGGNGDGYIAHFNSSLTNLIAATYLGGSGSDLGYSIAFYGNEVCIAGFTGSSTFPVTNGAYQTVRKGNDAFVLKMNMALSAVNAGTFVGGTGDDYAYTIAVDASGNIYISGQTTSSDFPTTGGVFQPALSGPSDTYIAKLNNSLTTLLASTYLGGSGGEQTNNLILDNSGNVYVTGWENSSDFPVTSGAYQSSYGGGQNDAYVTCINNSLSALVSSTYLGGSSDDFGYGLAIDASGNIIVSGFTGGASSSSDFPTTSGSFQPAYGGGYYNGFVSVLNSSATSLNESTFLGNYFFGYYLALGASGNIYFAGQAQSSIMPIAGNAYQPSSAGAADVYVCKFGSNVLAPKPPVVQFTADNTTVCTGTTVHYTDQSTNTPTTWHWSFQGGTPSTSPSQNPVVVYNASGSYDVKLVVSNGNGADSLVKTGYIIVSLSPVAGTVAANPTTICSGDSAQLTVTGNSGSVQWQSSANGASFTNITNDTTTTFMTSALAQTTYYRTEVTNGCGADSSAATRLVVNPLPTPVVTTNDSLICSGDSTRIFLTNSFAHYLWNTGDTTSTTAATQAGDYWLTVTDANNCSAISGHQNISTYPVASVSIIVRGDTLSSFNSTTYQWFLEDAIIPGATSPIWVANQSGDYSVEVIDTNGCNTRSNDTYVTVTGITMLTGNAEWSVYPVPFSNVFFIKGNNTVMGAIQSITVSDMTGRRILSKETGGQPGEQIMIDASLLAKGMYYLEIVVANKEYKQKIVKQ